MTIDSLHSRFPAAADYLSQIFLIERDYDKVTNLRLSERLGVSKPAVTQSIKRLSRLELVEQNRYGIINLTREGRKIAKEVMVGHYLLEHVLVVISVNLMIVRDGVARKTELKVNAENTRTNACHAHRIWKIL